MNHYLRVEKNEELADSFLNSRKDTEDICSPLAIEDYGLQAMAETSPAKWHLAHTTWFYETFLLRPFLENYQPFSDQFEYLFNSYYNGVGKQYKRNCRGLLSRPTVAEVYNYREYVNQHMLQLLEQCSDKLVEQVTDRVKLGIHHEQQHQELLLTDLKYCFYQNPLFPAYIEEHTNAPILSPSSDQSPNGKPNSDLTWQTIPEGLTTFGHEQDDEFCFDNETPCHPYFLHQAKISSRLITNGEFLEFIQSGGYQDPMLWLSDGWSWRNQEQVTHPLYWRQDQDGSWLEFTLYGLRKLDLSAPLCHVNLYEADAFAKWYGCRLPNEYEWEYFANQHREQLRDLDKSACYHPQPNDSLFYQVWQWTSSSYAPYPGYRTPQGAVGEYNGKFMCNQMVLRGGSCLTSKNHLRTTYRNFFYPGDRWQMTGIRLAKDLNSI